MPSEPPIASVIIAARDVAPYIQVAIRSALAQTLADFELFVVDDGSTDETLERSLSFRDPRLRVLRAEGVGCAAARNRVMGGVRGRYIAFLDGDDEWLPHHLSSLVGHLERHPELDLVFAASTWMGERGESLPRTVMRFEGPISLERMFVEFPPLTCSALCVRADVFREVGGFDETLSSCVDSALCLRVMRLRAGNCAGIPTIGLRYRRRAGQITANRQRKAEGWERLYAKHQALDPVGMARWGRHARASHLRALAAIAYEDGAFAESRLWMAKALLESPRSLARDPRTWITGAAVASTLLPGRWRVAVENTGVRLLQSARRSASGRGNVG
jgi:hypothetical protein